MDAARSGTVACTGQTRQEGCFPLSLPWFVTIDTTYPDRVLIRVVFSTVDAQSGAGRVRQKHGVEAQWQI